MSFADALQKLANQMHPPAGPRFENGRYRDCKWCQGRGCVSCKIEADKEYARQFPNGPEPIATFNTNDPDDMARARKICGVEAIEKAFSEGGGGVAEIISNAENNPPANTR